MTSFLAVQTDFIRFPWGVVPLSSIVRDKKGDTSPEQILTGWSLTSRALVGDFGFPQHAFPRGAVVMLERQLCDRTGISESSAKKFVRAFRVLVAQAEMIWAFAESAVDPGHLRYALESRGVRLEQSTVFLFDLICQGTLPFPDTAEAAE